MSFKDTLRSNIRKANKKGKIKTVKYHQDFNYPEPSREEKLFREATNDKKLQKLLYSLSALNEKIEESYAVLRNMNDFSGRNADKVISLCEKYILLLKDEIPYRKKYEFNRKYATAYKRLAMIYENRGDYYKAAQTCVRSINDGYPNDGSKSSMRKRLSRMIKKGNLKPTWEMQKILSETFKD